MSWILNGVVNSPLTPVIPFICGAGVSIEKLEDLYATAMDYGITLVTISHERHVVHQNRSAPRTRLP